MIGERPTPTRGRIASALRALCAALVAILCLAPGSASAQSDEQLWLSAAVRTGVTDDLDLSLNQMVRFDQGMSRVGKAAPELGWVYDLPKGFRVHGGYRFTADRRTEGDWRYEHRLFVGARYDFDVGPVEFGYRLEFQEDIYEKRGQRLNDNVIRNRVSVSLESHDIVRPFVSCEKLANLGGEPGTGLRNWRATVGTALNFGDHDFDVFYRLRRPFEAPFGNDHIIGVGYRLTI